MRIVCSKDELIKGLQIALPIATGKATLPILSNVLLETEDNKLKIAASDLETSVSFYIKAEIVEQGAITIPAKKLFDIIKEVVSDEIEIKNIDGDIVNIKAGKSKFVLNGINKKDYPLINEFPQQDHIVFNAKTFADMLIKTVYAVSKDAQRYVLNGVYLSLKQNVFTVVGTDGKRLAYIVDTLQTDMNIEKTAIIPTKAVVDIIKILGTNTENKELLFAFTEENRIAIKFGDITFFAAVIDGKFPNYVQILPKENQDLITVKLNVAQTLSAIKQAALFTLANVGVASPVKLTFDKNQLLVSASSSTAGSGEIEMDVEFSNKKVTLLFNPQYLKDVLQNIECENVILNYSTETSPAYFIPENNAHYINVVMPIRN
jgi:DNA polymerase-3 subunit beta